MRNTSNVKRYYVMNLHDGRILLATRELLTNPDYRVISEALARKIESRLIDWRKSAFELRQRDNLDQGELMKRAEQEKVKNVRQSAITRENVEQFETKLSEAEVGEVFDGGASEQPPADDGGDAPAPAGGGEKKSGKKSGKKQSKPTKEEQPPADDGGEDEPDNAEAPAEDLDI
jgi:hypothetical protein